MTDEEKRVIESVKEEYKKGIEQGSVLFPIFLNQANIILNLIKKQQREIEELEDTLKCTQNSWYEDGKIIEELKEQCKEVVCVPEGTCFILEPKEINKKWEDKIKAKIEEVKDGTYDAKIVLQSFLKE